MQNDTVIAVDVAKAVFQVAVSDRPGHVCRRERPVRDQFLAFFIAYPGSTVVMEACGSAHYWGRELQRRGHRVVLLPPHHVRPYVRGNKTDRTDSKAIIEALRNAEIHPLPIKTVAQQTLTSLHRLRSGWMVDRTARLNALRGLLRDWASSSLSARGTSCPRCGLTSRMPTRNFRRSCDPSSRRLATKSGTSSAGSR